MLHSVSAHCFCGKCRVVVFSRASFMGTDSSVSPCSIKVANNSLSISLPRSFNCWDIFMTSVMYLGTEINCSSFNSVLYSQGGKIIYTYY